jgi:hypothetical protein
MKYIRENKSRRKTYPFIKFFAINIDFQFTHPFEEKFIIQFIFFLIFFLSPVLLFTTISFFNLILIDEKNQIQNYKLDRIYDLC